MAPKYVSVLFLCCWISLGPLTAAPKTMRLDYFHTGDASHEVFSVDRVVIEPLDWPGNPAKGLDGTNLGKYFFEVIDRGTNRTVYSRGFASVYGEWETTGEAKRVHRTFHESVRFPVPRSPVQVVIKKRNAQNAFREVWSTLVDPTDMFVDTSVPPSPGEVIEILKNGPSSTKVDFLMMGDGYTESERPKCESDARRLVGLFFEEEPFKSRREDFNVWLICPPAPQTGVSRPSQGIHKDSPVGTTYDFFGSERYLMTLDNRAFRETASFAPYEFVEILVNSRTYGGGGIFNLYATVAVDNLWAPYVFIHEFGHHFAGLADEYYTSSVAYESEPVRTEPWEANATALLDPGKLKWGHLTSSTTPIPTPWEKEKFEAHAREIASRRQQIREQGLPEEKMEALFKEQSQWEMDLLGQGQYSSAVGAFEGAMYEAQGYYRPQADCIMFSRNEVPFCAVCSEALERVIDLYVK